MKRHMLKKLNHAARRTLTLLLAMLMLSGSVYADNTDEKAMRELYGDDWQKVAALQPGDSYISGENLYICQEEIYVDWKRVRSADDLDPSGWGNEERLLLMTDYTGYNLYLATTMSTPTRNWVEKAIRLL